MSGKRGSAFISFHIPDNGDPILSGGHDLLFVGRKFSRPDPPGVPDKLTDLLPAFDIP